MINYDLPTSVEIAGTPYEIRSDYRAALDICAALSDQELDGQDKARVALEIFYPDLADIPPEHYQEAIDKCLWFLNGGQEESGQKGPVLVSWEQDFSLIAPAVNRVAGQEIRSIPYLHFWSFLGYYMEIGGECAFAQIVSIRDKKARGKKLEKHEHEYYKRNRHLVDIKRKYTHADDELLKQWI